MVACLRDSSLFLNHAEDLQHGMCWGGMAAPASTLSSQPSCVCRLARRLCNGCARFCSSASLRCCLCSHSGGLQLRFQILAGRLALLQHLCSLCRPKSARVLRVQRAEVAQRLLCPSQALSVNVIWSRHKRGLRPPWGRRPVSSPAPATCQGLSLLGLGTTCWSDSKRPAALLAVMSCRFMSLSAAAAACASASLAPSRSLRWL